MGDIRIQKTPSRNVITQIPDEVQISKYITDHHKGIISRAVWEEAQRKLAEQGRKYHPYEDQVATDEMDQAVLSMIEDGWSGREIADRLEITITQEVASVKRLKRKGLLEDRGYESTKQREKEVFHYLCENGCVRRNDLLEQFKFTGKQMDRVLIKLECKGKIQRTGRGMWNVRADEDSIT